MFQNDKKIISVADAVKQVTEAEKVQTPTGMKVYGSSYGNSQKARADQVKKDIDKLKGPKDKEMKEAAKPDYLDFDKDGNKKESMKKALADKAMKEELKGNQDKIDANHNDKIDAQDFAILRGKKKMKEGYDFVSRLIDHAVFAEEVEMELNEVLSKDASAGDWIHDFIHSDNPKFKGKTKAERKKMALGAYYAKQNEGYENSAEDKKEDAKEAKKRGMTLAQWEKSAEDKKQDKEEMKEAHDYAMADGPITTDTLAGRVDGGKSDSFKSYKLRVNPTDKEGDGSVRKPDCEQPEETTARSSIKAKGGEVEVKPATIHANESFEDEHGIGRDIADKKEKMDRLKTPAKPGPLHNVGKGLKAFLKGKPEPMESVEVEGETLEEKAGYSAKSARAGKDIGKPGKEFAKISASAGKRYGSAEAGKRVAGAILAKLRKEETIEEKKDLAPGQDDAPFDPPYTTGKPDNIKDKSGAIHTPMSRAKDLARQAMKRVKTEMLGKAPGNN